MGKQGDIIRVVVMILLVLAGGGLKPVSAQDNEKQWLLAQINSLRAQQGLPAYAWNAQLAAAAQQQSEYMAATGHISHEQSNGSRPVDRAAANGYSGGWVSENIYGGGLATAADAWTFWINSPVHYAGLVNSNTNEIGIGVAASGNGRFYTLVFGRGQSGSQAPPASSADQASPIPATAYRPPPPTPTFTPSPTIPTWTPTVTWTPTATWTPSATPTQHAATSTPIVLPTVAAQVITRQPRVTTTPMSDECEDCAAESSLEKLLPYFLAVQVILIGVGIVSLFWYRRSHD